MSDDPVADWLAILTLTLFISAMALGISVIIL
jgi:hypothetical protein